MSADSLVNIVSDRAVVTHFIYFKSDAHLEKGIPIGYYPVPFEMVPAGTRFYFFFLLLTIIKLQKMCRLLLKTSKCGECAEAASHVTADRA